MIKKIIIFSILFSVFFNLKIFAQTKIHIVYKINNEIITNIDIKDEAKYLVALNNQLKNLDNKVINKIATESIIRETIKKIELVKYFKLGQKNELLENIIKNFYMKLGLTNITQFETYLEGYSLTLNDVQKKIEVEATWNKLIFEKYKDLIEVDTSSLKEKISKNKKLAYKKKYNLSEILFEKNKEQTIAEKFKKIEESIIEIGFKNTANIYSVSDSSKFGGEIGWVDQGNLSKKILSELEKIKINEYTKPIQLNNNFLIIKIENIKKEKIKIDKKKELNQMTQFETNRQLENYSKIYYNRIKINTTINEL